MIHWRRCIPCLLLSLISTAGCVQPAVQTLPAPVEFTPMPTAAPTPAPALPTPTPAAPAIMNEQTRRLTADMILAAEAGDTPTVLDLLAAGAALDGQDERGRTAVMAATHGNRVETVRALIAAGADINLRDRRSDNPFLYAGAEGLLEILQLTIAAQADTRLTNRFGGTALIPAADRGHVEIVAELLTRTDVDVNHINNLGWTALLEAIILSDGGVRHQQIVQLLVDHGADVTIADFEGVTPLAHAQQRGFAEIAAILQQAGAR